MVGLIAALADSAMGHSCARQMGGAASLVTIGLAVDFISSAEVGRWLAVESDVIRTGTTICFAQSLVKADDAVIARANATFRVVPQAGMTSFRGAQSANLARHPGMTPCHCPKCQSLVSTTRSMKARTLAESSARSGKRCGSAAPAARTRQHDPEPAGAERIGGLICHHPRHPPPCSACWIAASALFVTNRGVRSGAVRAVPDEAPSGAAPNWMVVRGQGCRRAGLAMFARDSRSRRPRRRISPTWRATGWNREDGRS